MERAAHRGIDGCVPVGASGGCARATFLQRLAGLAWGGKRRIKSPANYHNQATAFSFADGHGEIKKWTDPRTIPLLEPGAGFQLLSGNMDAVWLVYYRVHYRVYYRVHIVHYRVHIVHYS